MYIGNWEVLNRARGLRAVVRLCGHFDKTKRVFFFAEIGHKQVGS
jgi:hypothetical protein